MTSHTSRTTLAAGVTLGVVIAVAVALFAGSGVAAQGHGGGGMHPGDPGQGHHPGHPGGGHMPGHPGMHENMPAECLEMSGDPGMMQHMMRMMHGDIDPAECAAWMNEHDMPAEHQARCLVHMAKATGRGVAPDPMPEPAPRRE